MFHKGLDLDQRLTLIQKLPIDCIAKINSTTQLICTNSMIISQEKCIMQMTPHTDKMTDSTNAKDQDQYLSKRQEKQRITVTLSVPVDCKKLTPLVIPTPKKKASSRIKNCK